MTEVVFPAVAGESQHQNEILDNPTRLRRLGNLALHEGGRFFRYVGGKTLDLAGRDAILPPRERAIDAIGLGALAAASTVAQFKYNQEFRNSAFPVGFLVYSGRHFLAGNLLAARVKTKSKFNSFMGIMAASMIGDVAAEAGQSVIMTGYVHNGWGNVGDFVLPKEVFWGNAKDAAAALAAGALVYGQSRWRASRQQNLALPEAELQTSPID